MCKVVKKDDRISCEKFNFKVRVKHVNCKRAIRATTLTSCYVSAIISNSNPCKQAVTTATMKQILIQR